MDEGESKEGGGREEKVCAGESRGRPSFDRDDGESNCRGSAEKVCEGESNVRGRDEKVFEFETRFDGGVASMCEGTVE